MGQFFFFQIVAWLFSILQVSWMVRYVIVITHDRKISPSDRFIVHGTVRTRTNRKRVKPITKFRNAVKNLKLFECDLRSDTNWDR